MATQVTGDLYMGLDGKLIEIKRQIRQPGGYPFDPEKLNKFLQRAVEGRFQDGQQWREENGVIYFEVTSDGTTGPKWIERLKKKNFQLSDSAKSVLRSSDFKPTSSKTYRIAVLKGRLFTDSDRITNKIRAEANARNLEVPSAEVACLIREKFSDEDLETMGFWWIVVFHEPISDSSGGPRLLGVGRDDIGRWLRTYYDGPGDGWGSGDGFAFALPQVSD